MTRARLARSTPLPVLSLLLVAASLTLFSCTPGDEISVQESDVVLTTYDPEVDFGGIYTYVMPDTINHLLEEGDDDDISRKYDRQILDLIEANLNARGYLRIEEGSPGTPDVVVFVSATVIENWYAYSYYPWYGYPGYCCYYPYYPYWGVSYAYTTGTLIVDMVDTNEIDVDTDLYPNYWRGVVSGVLDDVESSKVARFTDSINQLFIQSPYLQSRGQ
jgi:hypothetical protein